LLIFVVPIVVPTNYDHGVAAIITTTLMLAVLGFIFLGSLGLLIYDSLYRQKESAMLLAIDISNTNIKLGLYAQETMHHHWVISTIRHRTSDEYAMLLSDLLKHAGYSLTDITDIIISCVVPPLTRVFQELAIRYCKREALIVNTAMDLGIKLLVDNPWEVGTDRLVTILAAHALYGGPAIVIAFSTATTFDVISRQGDFLGGAIAPGLIISAEALSNAASQLFRVEMNPPRTALGKNTIENMQSGIIYGHVGLVQGLIKHLLQEIPDINDEHEVKIVAHGGLAQLMAPLIPEIQHVNQYLPLEGLHLAYKTLRSRSL
jgi:type III pantothenate kinase